MPRMVALAVAGEGEFADLHLAALRARLRLRQADAADARLGIGAARDAVPIDRHGRLARHVRHRDHAFARGHMRQLRRSRHHVADGVDAGFGGLLVLIHLDEAAVQLDLGVLQADVFGVRLAAHGDQQLFALRAASCLPSRVVRVSLHAVAGLLDVVGAWRRFPRESSAS